MYSLFALISFAVFLTAQGLSPREVQKSASVISSKPSDKRNKRSLFPFVVGETILDIQCKQGYLTVCAPDGPSACPIGYSSQTNVGICGFATLNHYLNTSNLAGTCCYKSPVAATTTTTASSVKNTSNILIPQIIAYPVYVQYPYGMNNYNPATPSNYNPNYAAPTPAPAYQYYAPPTPAPVYYAPPTPAPVYYAPPTAAPSYYVAPPSNYAAPPVYLPPLPTYTPAPVPAPAPSYNPYLNIYG
ncbi:LIM domain-binding protein 3-like [Paramacrobiotus metropolitanus]|uniref:LIM domain-binding protein 3-like n=1 Tax=Paramacrobiotus metropolitanus TaxID=2943436 RepID=UPI0024463AFD|nr:LIM domain-binding protein 3-like [Paramacrobiotus metropolitanus]